MECARAGRPECRLHGELLDECAAVDQLPQQFIVSLNRNDAIDPSKVLRRMRYRHPVQNAAALAAQTRKAEIQGVQNTWFAGAAWGFGFHEDGLRSGVDVAQGLGVRW